MRDDVDRSARRRRWWGLAGVLLALWPGLATAARPQVVVVIPFETASLDRDQSWLGEAVARVLNLGLTQHPGFVQVERGRLRALAPRMPETEAAVLKTGQTLGADVAVFGRVTRTETELIVQAKVLELKGAGGDALALAPISLGPAELPGRLATLPGAVVRVLRVNLGEAEAVRMEKAARPTGSARAFELFVRGHQALARGDQEGNETAVDLLSRAIEADPTFAVAQYTLGVVHQALGNRWKAAAQFRASTQLDARYPEPYKALGDLLLAQPRRLFDQAVEAYQKAIELRPFYADAHVGLGDARAAKGDIDGAIAAYQRALSFNPVNPRVHMSLGRIYYTEKGLYYESVSAYQRAIELDPRAVEVRMGLGEVYEDKGLYKEAIEEYRRVLELDPKHTGALYNLALVFEKVDAKEAIVHWERYIGLASQVPAEKDWVDVARQHLRKLRNQVKE